MGRAISNKNVLAAQFETADFDGPFLASFGRPELRGVWLIWGDMAEAGSNIILLNKEELPELRARLSKRKSPEIIVIDSLQYLDSFTWRLFKALKKDYPDKLFIFISQVDKSGNLADKLAVRIRFDADIKIKVEGFKAFVTTRYEDSAKGEGGADFIIWQQGANDYWAGQI